MKRNTKAAPRPTQQSGEEWFEISSLCIRVMERFFAATNANPKMEPLYLDLLDAYMDVLQEELTPFAFDLAYALFSREKVATERRRDLDRE